MTGSPDERSPDDGAPRAPPPPRALVILVLVLLLLAVGFSAARATVIREITDTDELWHLATGRRIVEEGRVPDRDVFTWTAGDTPWTNTNWLAQVVLYDLFRRGGLELDWLLGCALLLGATALVHLRARAHVRSPWVAAPFVFTTLPVLATGSTVRPQGWTFFLLALVLLLVDRVCARPRAAPAVALGAALALAGQLHGGFVFVFGAVGLAAAGEAWDGLRGARPEARRTVALLAGSVGLGLAGFALHPHGRAALLHPLTYGLDPRVREIFVVQELSAPDLTHGATSWTGFWVLALAALGMCGGRAWRTRDALAVLAFLQLAIATARGLHYLAVVVPAPAAIALEGALGLARERSPGPVRRLVQALDGLEPAARSFVRLVPAVLALVLGIGLALSWPRIGPGRPGDVASPHLGPAVREVVAATSFLEEKHVPGRILNEMETGGTLAWACPGTPTFIDGRGDLHAISGAWHDMVEIVSRRPGWLELLDRRRIDVAVLDRDGTLAWELGRAGWRTAWATPEKPPPVGDRSVAIGSPVGYRVLVRPGSAAETAVLDQK